MKTELTDLMLGYLKAMDEIGIAEFAYGTKDDAFDEEALVVDLGHDITLVFGKSDTRIHEGEMRLAHWYFDDCQMFNYGPWIHQVFSAHAKYIEYTRDKAIVSHKAQMQDIAETWGFNVTDAEVTK